MKILVISPPDNVRNLKSLCTGDQKSNNNTLSNHILRFANLLNVSEFVTYTQLRNFERKIKQDHLMLPVPLKKAVDTIWGEFLTENFPKASQFVPESFESFDMVDSKEALKEKMHSIALEITHSENPPKKLDSLKHQFLIIFARNIDLLEKMQLSDLGTEKLFKIDEIFARTLFKIIATSSCVCFSSTFAILTHSMRQFPPSLRELSISPFCFTEEELKKNFKNTNLEVLKLNFSEVTQNMLSVNALNDFLKKQAPSLKELSLSGEIPGIDDFSVFEGIPFDKLEKLEISSKAKVIGKDDVTFDLFSRLKAKSLKELVITCDNLKLVQNESLPSEIEVLKLTVPKLHQFYLAVFAIKCRNLKTIHVNFPKRDDEELTYQILNPDTKFTKIWIPQVLKQAAYDKIEELQLTGIKLFSHEILYGLKLKNLKVLTIEADRIAPDAFKNFKAPQLKEIHLTVGEMHALKDVPFTIVTSISSKGMASENNNSKSEKS